MLALFFALGRLLAHFTPLAAFVLGFGWFFGVFGRCKIDFGGSWGRPGNIWAAPNPYFSMFLRARELAVYTNSGCAKTTVFPVLFLGFKRIAHVARQTQNDTISLLVLVERSNPQRSC